MSIKRFGPVNGTVIPCRVNVLTPVHQGTFADLIDQSRIDLVEGEGGKKKLAENFMPINTMKVWSTTDGWIDVPIVSGNSLRGRLRRAAARSFFSLLREAGSKHEFLEPFMRNNVSLTVGQQWVASLFFNGGVIYKKPNTNSNQQTPSEDGDQESASNKALSSKRSSRKDADPKTLGNTMDRHSNRDEIERLFVPLPLFGYVDGMSRLIPSKLKVTNLLLHCDETDSILHSSPALGSVLVNNEGLPRWRDAVTGRLINRGQQNEQTITKYPRAQIVRSGVSQRIFNQYENKSSDDQMFAYSEYLPAGVHLYGSMHLDEDARQEERGCFYEALKAVAGQGVLGGMNARGFGEVSWDIDLPDEMEEDITAYRDFVKSHATEAEDLFKCLAVPYQEDKKGQGAGS